MNFDIPSFLATGLISLPWWGYIVVALALTHVTIASVTIYLHRSQAHRGLDLHPVITDRIPMKDFSKAMERLKTGEARKILVYPNGVR